MCKHCKQPAESAGAKSTTFFSTTKTLPESPSSSASVSLYPLFTLFLGSLLLHSS